MGTFLHFNIIGHNPFERFETFREENNNNPLLENNNSNNPLPPPLSEFKKSFRGEFNPSPEKNSGGLNSNIVALVNILAIRDKSY